MKIPCLPCLPFPLALLQIWHPAQGMRHAVFDETSGFVRENDQATPITWKTPADELIEAEDEQGLYDELSPAPNDADASKISRCDPDILSALLRFLIPPVGKSKRFKLALIRLVLLGREVGIEGIADVTLEQLGSQLGLTRAAMSHWSVRMVDELDQFSARNGRSRETRQLNAVRASETAERLGHGVRHGTGMSPEEREKRRLAVNASRRKAKEKAQSV